ncbi:hypothetical protein LY76DRAFT_614165 [Colletotrichum caudatum]|nr:hypothetical protein LY76DRAFT_614165 [Colletotrichum caudatum]
MAPSKTDHKAYDAIALQHSATFASSKGEVANAAAKAEQARELALQNEFKAADARSEKDQDNAAQAMMMAEANNKNAQQQQQQQQPAASKGRRRRYHHDPNRIPKSGYTLHCIRCGVRRSHNDELCHHLRKKHFPALFPGLEHDALLAHATLDKAPSIIS